MIQEQYSRISHHTITATGLTGTTLFTVPSTEDFTDDSWSVTDLALSEIGVAEGVGRAFIRIGDEIKEFNFTSGGTGGGNQNLNQVLTVGNTTGGQDIEITSGDLILGQNQGVIDFDLGGRLVIAYDTSYQSYYTIGNDFVSAFIPSITTTNGFPVATYPGTDFKKSDIITTTGNTATDLAKVIETTPSGSRPFAIKAWISAVEDTSTPTKFYMGEIYGVFALSAGTTLFQVETINKIEKRNNLSTATSNFRIDTVNTDIYIEVTGEVSTNLNWRTSLHIYK